MRVHVRFHMAFGVPDESGMTAEERAALDRIEAAGKSIASMSGKAVGDVHHLADAADVIERLANVMRRARASAATPEDERDDVL